MNSAAVPETYFAPAKRAAPDRLEATIKAATKNPLIDAVLTSHGTMAIVLNQERQIVAMNGAYMRFLGADKPDEFFGLRHGETINCPHAEEAPGGCGTSRECRSCGAAVAIVACQQTDSPVEMECVLTTRMGDQPVTLDFRVRAFPLQTNDNQFLLLFLRDVSQEKRREALEQAFFHDIANVLNGVEGTVQLLDSGIETPDELLKDLRHLANRLRREVDIQRALAEEGERTCEPEWEEVRLGEIVEALRHLYRSHPAAKERHLSWPMTLPTTAIRTDRSLLLRVLANMITNACEATPEGGAIRIDIRESADNLVFEVSNPGEIPPDQQGRIFQRYFTTRPGVGRGQGTYSMKLFGEKALGGKVSFTSSIEEGTSFRIELPKR